MVVKISYGKEEYASRMAGISAAECVAEGWAAYYSDGLWLRWFIDPIVRKPTNNRISISADVVLSNDLVLLNSSHVFSLHLHITRICTQPSTSRNPMIPNLDNYDSSGYWEDSRDQFESIEVCRTFSDWKGLGGAAGCCLAALSSTHSNVETEQILLAICKHCYKGHQLDSNTKERILKVLT
jgi:hypothetical protein